MSFDPEEFLNVSVEGALDTKYPVVSSNKYPAVVDGIDAMAGTIENGERAGEPWRMLLVKWSIMDEEVKKELGKDKVLVSQSIFLDLDANGQIAIGKGKNVKLGKLREALGQNDASQPWTPMYLIGQMGEIDVTIDVNKKTGEEQNNVRGVAPYEG